MKPRDGGKHYALRSKAGRKRISSLPDQAKLALQMQAAILEISGQGGGITDLLRPKTNAEAVRLNRLAATYEVVSLPIRSGTPNDPPERVKARNTVAGDELIAQLAAEFGRSVGTTARPHEISVQNFVNWLFKNVAAKGCTLGILAAHGRTLLDETDKDNVTLRHSQAWWIDQIGLRRKKLR